MNVSRRLLFAYLSFSFLTLGAVGKKLHITVLKGGLCSEEEHTFVSIDNWNVSGDKLFLNATINVTADMNPYMTAVFRTEKCASRESPDTCELFRITEMKNYCSKMMQKSTGWKDVIENFEPKIQCPTIKGIYKSTNFVKDFSPLYMFPATHAYWKVKFSLVDKKTGVSHMCLYSEADY